jgi:hypothetical protein
MHLPPSPPLSPPPPPHPRQERLLVLSRPHGRTSAGSIKSIKILYDPIGKRTRDLPGCGALPQRTAPPLISSYLVPPLYSKKEDTQRNVLFQVPTAFFAVTQPSTVYPLARTSCGSNRRRRHLQNLFSLQESSRGFLVAGRVILTN